FDLLCVTAAATSRQRETSVVVLDHIQVEDLTDGQFFKRTQFLLDWSPVNFVSLNVVDGVLVTIGMLPVIGRRAASDPKPCLFCFGSLCQLGGLSFGSRSCRNLSRVVSSPRRLSGFSDG